MENKTINPAPPSSTNLVWRTIQQHDLDAIVELAKSCRKVDGGLFFLFEPDYVKRLYFSNEKAKGIGAFTADGRCAAFITVNQIADPPNQRARITGHVRPELRYKGFGTFLIGWATAQARNLLMGENAAPGVIQVSTESLTESAHHLYLAHGFESVFEELVMEQDLLLPLANLPMPPDVIISNWQPDLAFQFFQAYQAAFQERPGFPGYSAEEWIAKVSEDEHKPEWSLLATVDGVPAGFVISDLVQTSQPPCGYIAQVGVIPAQRRRGLASALLNETMRRMQHEGVLSALLTVHINNPDAIAAYSQLGFKKVGRRARYEQVVDLT